MIFNNSEFKRIRLQKRWSLSALAKDCGISRRSLSLWENGKQVPTEKKIREVATFLNIDVSEICDLDKSAPVSSKKLQDTINESILSSNIGDSSQAVNSLFSGINGLYKELKNKELIIKALLKSINSELYIKDINHHYVAVTDSFLKNRGLPLNYSVKGKSDNDFYPIKEADKNSKQDISVIRAGKPLDEVEDYIPGSRKKRWGVIAKIPIFDSDNSVMGIVGVFFDITERKAHEEIRELLEINVNSISDSLVIRDCRTGKYIYINPAAEEQFGYPAQRFLNGGIKFWLDTCIHPEERDLHYKYFNSGEWPDRREYRVILPDGSVKWLEGSISFQYYKGTECFVAVNRDITDRKMSENIRSLMEMALKDSSQYILWLLERPPSLKAVYVSDSVATIYGYPPENFTKERNFWLEHCVHEDDRAKLAEDWFEGIGSYVKQLLFRVVKPDKSIRWIECFSSKIFDNYVVYIEKDVTERVTKIKSTKVEAKKELAEDLLKHNVDKDIIFKTTGVRFK